VPGGKRRFSGSSQGRTGDVDVDVSAVNETDERGIQHVFLPDLSSERTIEEEKAVRSRRMSLSQANSAFNGPSEFINRMRGCSFQLSRKVGKSKSWYSIENRGLESGSISEEQDRKTFQNQPLARKSQASRRPSQILGSSQASFSPKSCSIIGCGNFQSFNW
jgi:hypothetical protein